MIFCKGLEISRCSQPRGELTARPQASLELSLTQMLNINPKLAACVPHRLVV